METTITTAPETKGDTLRRLTNDLENGKAEISCARAELVTHSPAVAAKLSEALATIRSAELMLAMQVANVEAKQHGCDVVVEPAERLAHTVEGQPYRPRFGDTNGRVN